jgi:hypothetical protein
MDLRFLTPTAGLIALAVLVPLALLALTERRSGRVRALLGLTAPGRVDRLELPVALCALAALLGLAAAQPVLRTERPQLARRDAQVFFALDISRSMLASTSAASPTRLERAQEIAVRLRAALADTPAGIATFTDRPLPLLFPTSNRAAFTATVEQAVGVERPPPRSTAATVTSFDALEPIPGAGYFRPGVAHRLLVVVSDAESEGFDVDLVRQSFAARPRIGVVLVRVGRAGERVFGPDGLPEPAYIPPPTSGRALASFLAATHGRAFGEGSVGAAAQAAQALLGTGPRARLGSIASRKDLAPWFVLAAALPLGAVVRRRNL